MPPFYRVPCHKIKMQNKLIFDHRPVYINTSAVRGCCILTACLVKVDTGFTTKDTRKQKKLKQENKK